eukprot:CAMPEP_0169097510 /NCGR_PEP_ID=MMETSP1015-20121227/19558_1 /TAXON_ID=342587 /ORGANISM="Karlodinium micrum, Strain CCMP2283" /LENGTH=133 /DNA_ID=CAMNT_0009158321 /DNA_START=54 /DNA_END=455 /DNA_ORIENTATION=-
MVWLPDHIWEKQRKSKGGGGKSGGGDVLQLLLKAIGGGGGGKGWSGGGGKSQKPPFKKDTSGGELGEHIGTIKKQGYKYSFIECEALVQAGYGDVFVWWDEVKQYKKGQKVKFTAFLNKDGKLGAKDLKSGLK